MKAKGLNRFNVTILFVLLCLPYLPVAKAFGAPVCAFVKTLPIILLILAVGSNLRNAKDKQSQRMAIMALIFSLLGDFFGDMRILLGDKTLLFQIGFFAVAQFIYAGSFSRNRQRGEEISNIRYMGGTLARILIIAYVVFFGSLILPHTSGALYIAMGIYMTLIASMFLTCSLQNRDGYIIFLLGALLFVFSDSVIAYNMFIERIPYRDELVMGSYYLAQLLLNFMLIKRR